MENQSSVTGDGNRSANESVCMRFSIASLLALTAFAAFGCYAVLNPSFVFADAIEFLLNTTCAIGFVIAARSRGVLRSGALSYSVFTLIGSHLGTSPESFANWIAEVTLSKASPRQQMHVWVVGKTLNNFLAVFGGVIAAAASPALTHRRPSADAARGERSGGARTAQVFLVSLAMAGYLGIACYSVLFPSFLVADLLELLLNIGCASSILIAFHCSGRTQAAAIGFAAFTFVFSWIGTCPDLIAEWIAINISRHDGIPSYSTHKWVIIKTINHVFAICLGWTAAAMSLAFSQSIGPVIEREAEP
ncbi:hypothetical protein [Roseimaritima sediminicola]|uniref:hypothetical protein n=1 Tax=Roseimaritima sediminicola TaxID=2662066 RepID=UPI001386F3C1|nr:hypothetical protein [Roseimaritima sediminicola]